MSTTAYEVSIGELCERLDALAVGVSEEFALHQQRMRALSEASGESGDPVAVRGAVLASAFSLLEAVEGLQAQVAEVREIITQQQKLLDSLHEESRTDVLTGQLNRRAFDEELARRTAEAKRTGNPLGMLLVDIDRFKAINDSYGHAAGDKVLKGVANVLTNSLRDMDLVARYGGEEFAIILPNTNLLNACRAAERARTAVSSSVFRYDEHELAVTISAGVTVVNDGGEGHIKHADDALYAAKQAGRNRVFAYKDGYCQPLHQEPSGEHGAQRRRWMRFMADRMQVKFRCGDGPWRVAMVRDESLTGIGLFVYETIGIEFGEIIKIDYCDDLRAAEVMYVEPVDDGATTRLGLRWIEGDSV